MKLEKLFENARVDEIPLPTKIKFGYITNDREHIRFENDEIPQKRESIYVFGHIAGFPVSGVVANVFEDNRLEIWLSESRPVILGLAPWSKEND